MKTNFCDSEDEPKTDCNNDKFRLSWSAMPYACFKTKCLRVYCFEFYACWSGKLQDGAPTIGRVTFRSNAACGNTMSATPPLELIDLKVQIRFCATKAS